MATLYFAYGSNLDVAQMRRRCPQAQLLGPATLWGWRFRIGGSGYATVVPESGAVVYGVLWQLTVVDEARLDAYEGVEEGIYRKASLAVEHGFAVPEQVMVYLATDGQPGTPVPNYLGPIVTSARAHGFPENYLEELQGWA